MDDDGLLRRHLRPVFAEKSAEAPSASAPVAVASTVASDSSSVAKTVRASASASASASAYANSASAFIAEGHSDSENPDDLRLYRRVNIALLTLGGLCAGGSRYKDLREHLGAFSNASLSLETPGCSIASCRRSASHVCP